MEGMRVFVYLNDEDATVSDLRVGKQRKKPTKSANKRVQGVDVEGERAAVARHYPSFSPFDAILVSSPLSLPLSRSSFFFIVVCRSGRRRGGWRCIVKHLTRTERAWRRSQHLIQIGRPFQPAGCLIFIMLKLYS